MKYLLFTFFLFIVSFFSPLNFDISPSVSQTSDTIRLSFWFMGDIMQHKPQIDAAWDSQLKTYRYDTCFHFVRELFTLADFSIANLEFTFGGAPYTGYPQFSAPDQMGHAIKNAGINVLVTANNHSCDRGLYGIIRTIRVVDSLKILRTGTFLDSNDYKKNHPLILEKDGFRVAVLNYSYGTNGLPIPPPTVVNLIDTHIIRRDIIKAKALEPDEIIVFFHWGNEYERFHNSQQTAIARLCFRHGARIVIGSHPHVIQPMHNLKNPFQPLTHAVVIYSLGNYISNQRQLHRDGGAMVYIRLRKIQDIVEIEKIGYVLTWVWTPVVRNKKYHFIIPISKYERQPEMFDSSSYNAMMLFARETRIHLQHNNINVHEISWCPFHKKWLID